MLLTQRTERAEAALEEVSTELNGLKGRVSQMVAAIFGKSSVFNPVYFLLTRNISRQLTLCLQNMCRSTKQESKPRPCD